MQAVLLACHVIVDVVTAAVFSPIESVSLSHYCVHSDEVTTVDLDSGREQVGVTQGRPELNPAGTSAGTRLWKIHKSLPHTRLGLEARVGIGQVRCFPPSLPIHFQHLRHQRHAASCVSNTPILKYFRRFVKPHNYAPTNHPILTNYSLITRLLALSLALIRV